MARFTARMFKDVGGNHRFRIVGGNGEKVAASEGYSRKADAKEIAAALVGPENVIDEGDNQESLPVESGPDNA